MSDRGVRRRRVLRGLAVAGTAPLITSSAGAASTGTTDEERLGPSGVHVAFGPDPQTTMHVGWTGEPAPEAHVEYAGPTGDGGSVPASAEPVPGERLVAYTAELAGLAPGATYEYRAVQAGRRSETFSFETAPPHGESFTVTAVGDHGIFDPENPFQRVQDSDPERVAALAADIDPAFHLLVGDISYANGHPSTWERYFRTFEGFYADRPFMTVPGNHEAEPGTGFAQYDRRLNDLMPTPEDAVPDPEAEPRWYDFRYGDVLFVGLNTSADACGDAGRAEEFVPITDPRCPTEDHHVAGERQARYVEETLDSAYSDDVRWTIVYFHGPLWTSSPNHEDRRDLRELWGETFAEYHVDLVISGDNHVYERTKPIVGTDVREVGEVGTTYVVNGTGGTSHYAFADRPDFIAARDNAHFGVIRLDVSAGRLGVRYVAYPADGDRDDDQFAVDYGTDDDVAPGAEPETVDEFTVVEDDDGRPRQVEGRA